MKVFEREKYDSKRILILMERIEDLKNEMFHVAYPREFDLLIRRYWEGQTESSVVIETLNKILDDLNHF